MSVFLDPNVFASESIDAETAEFNRKLEAAIAAAPPITVGTLDPLLDDSLFLHARWIAAGGRAELGVWPGGIHGFDAFPTALSRAARARMDAFLGG